MMALVYTFIGQDNKPFPPFFSPPPRQSPARGFVVFGGCYKECQSEIEDSFKRNCAKVEYYQWIIQPYVTCSVGLYLPLPFLPQNQQKPEAQPAIVPTMRTDW